MNECIYLDTARVGRPSSRTFQAATDSLVLAAEEGGSPYFDRFLRSGLGGCPGWMMDRYSGLQSWRGIAALKTDLRTLVGGSPDLPVLLANRSAQLMGFAARLFFPRCGNVLTCDLGWRAYQEILEQQAAQLSRRVTVAPVREMVFAGRATADEVIEMIARTYARRRCDGLFLPAVSNLGVRLPVERIVRRIEANGEVRMVVVDGAQEFCHAATELTCDFCDLYLAGCHKWLAGHHPMGVGFYGRSRTSGYVDTMLASLVKAGAVDDPLLRFTERIEAGRMESYTETVNLAALFTCQAAVAEVCESNGAATHLPTRLRTRQSIAQAVANTGWRPEPVDPALQSAILLARAERNAVRQTDPGVLRAAFRDRGVSLTAYEGGFVRLAVPSAPLSTEETQLLHNAFRLSA